MDAALCRRAARWSGLARLAHLPARLLTVVGRHSRQARCIHDGQQCAELGEHARQDASWCTSMRLEPGQHEWLLSQQAGAQQYSGSALPAGGLLHQSSTHGYTPMPLCRSLLTGCARRGSQRQGCALQAPRAGGGAQGAGSSLRLSRCSSQLRQRRWLAVVGDDRTGHPWRAATSTAALCPAHLAPPGTQFMVKNCHSPCRGGGGEGAGWCVCVVW